MRRRDKGQERGIARARILRLHELAERAALAGNEARAARYGGLARRLGMRYQAPVPGPLKRRVCPGCDAYLLPGRTARVRVDGGKTSITCAACGRIQRVPFRREQRARRPHGSA